MVKICPDTNRLLSFYRPSSANLVVLNELTKHKGSVVLTEQTVTEFRRNRVSALQDLLRQFKGTNDIPPLLRDLSEYKDLCKLLKDHKNSVVKRLEHLIDSEKDDPVAQKFLALAADSAVTNLKLTDEAIAKAHRRKLLGNPPCSPRKYTIGDEVIWELLLENMSDDLIVVTEDRTFHDNFPLLRDEYHQRTRKKLLSIADSLSDALKEIGQSVPEKLIEAEEEEKKAKETLSIDLRDVPTGSWFLPGLRDAQSWDAATTAAVLENHRLRQQRFTAAIMASNSTNPILPGGG